MNNYHCFNNHTLIYGNKHNLYCNHCGYYLFFSDLEFKEIIAYEFIFCLNEKSYAVISNTQENISNYGTTVIYERDGSWVSYLVVELNYFLPFDHLTRSIKIFEKILKLKTFA